MRAGALAATLPGAGAAGSGFPELRSTVWQSDASVQAAVQALTPQMTENKKRVSGWQEWLGGIVARWEWVGWLGVLQQPWNE